jgi:hypothetical protein
VRAPLSRSNSAAISGVRPCHERASRPPLAPWRNAGTAMSRTAPRNGPIDRGAGAVSGNRAPIARAPSQSSRVPSCQRSTGPKRRSACRMGRGFPIVNTRDAHSVVPWRTKHGSHDTSGGDVRSKRPPGPSDTFDCRGLSFRRAATKRWQDGWGLLSGGGSVWGRGDTPDRGGRCPGFPCGAVGPGRNMRVLYTCG